MAVSEVASVSIAMRSLPWRLGPADVKELAPWICGRLKDAYPEVSPIAMESWLRMAVANNEFSFMRTRGAVALFQIVGDDFGYRMVRERFVLTREGSEPEGAELYKVARAWAVNLGVRDIQVEVMSDVPREMIMAAIGKVSRRETYWVRIKP